jgi:cyclic beta-1,2-glucan synthetase
MDVSMTDNTMLTYIDIERLPVYAENTGKTIRTSGEVNGLRSARELSRILSNLKRICLQSERFARTAIKIPAEVEWLIDNRYIAEREAKGVIADLKKAKRLTGAKGSAYPVIYEAAAAFVRSGVGEVTEERLRCFLEHFQNALVLTEKELSLFVPMIKLALISALNDTAKDIAAMLACKQRDDSSNPFCAEELVDKLKSGGHCVSCAYLEKASEAKEAHAEMTSAAATVFSSLRLLSSLDASVILEDVSRIERMLLKDPAGVYPLMNQESRTMYRRDLAKLADRNGVSEIDAVSAVLRLSQSGAGKSSHVGHYIYEQPLGSNKNQQSGTAYIAANILAALGISLFSAFLLGGFLYAFLLILPVFELVKNLTDFVILKTTKPRKLPKMELKTGIPPEEKTLCVISALLSSPDSGKKYAKLLEEYRLSNRAAGKALSFCLLADLKESKSDTEDSDAAYINEARDAIEALNQKYNEGFLLLTRKRTYNAGDKRYMAWERKRGAILELVRLMRGAKSGIIVTAGKQDILIGTNYIILLDSDTALGVDTARELVGAMLHPLNRPVIDERKKIVINGHGLLQPRIALDLGAAIGVNLPRFSGDRGESIRMQSIPEMYIRIFLTRVRLQAKEFWLLTHIMHA